MGPALSESLAELVPALMMPTQPWGETEFFRRASVVLEIGSGMGEATLAMAQAEPQQGIIACDVHIRGLAALAQGAQERGLGNIRLFDDDALGALEAFVPESSLAGIRIWFPDPWPKNRHHKRRIVNSVNVALFASRLRPGGSLHVATDVAAYAEVIAETLAGCAHLQPEVIDGPRPSWRPWTKFERAGLAAGRKPHDFIYRRHQGDNGQ